MASLAALIEEPFTIRHLSITILGAIRDRWALFGFEVFDRLLFPVIVNKIDCALCLIAPSPDVMTTRGQTAAVNNQKGGSNAVDDYSNITNFVAVGIDQRLHDGRSYSYPAGHCRYRVSGTTSSREKNIVASWAFARRVKYFEMT